MAGTAGPLLDTIRSSAITAAANLVHAAQADAESIRASARQRAEAAREAALATHGRDAATALARTRAATAASVGRLTLTARAVALDRIFAEAERQALSLSAHPGLAGLLLATFDESASYLPAGPVKVGCNAAISGTLKAALASAGRKDFEVSVVDGAPLGLTLESADGSMLVDGTFPRRLARERSRLSAALARRLLEQPK